jgi:hypothetical protein
VSDEKVGAAAFFAQRRTILAVLSVPIGVFLIAASAILFGGTSHHLHTGSVEALEQAATEYLRLNGAPVAHIEVAGSISKANSYWGEFFAAPTTVAASSRFAGEYGFAQFEHHLITLPGHRGPVANYEWVVIAVGEGPGVGCAVPPAVSPVPAEVLSGFHVHCAVGATGATDS